MFDRLKHVVLAFMRVPHDPTPPFGAPGSVRIFRAGRNFLHLRLVRWGLGQVAAVIGLAFSITFLAWFKSDIEAIWRAEAPAAVAPAPVASTVAANADRGRRTLRGDPAAQLARDVARHGSPWMLVVLEIFEGLAVLLFVAQIPLSLAVVWLEFDLHWYMVTDRSLRIRTGILRLQESTMSFANLQQVEVKQGPLQRLLGLADLHVQSAGGGGDPDRRHARAEDSLHTGIFHGVEHAAEIRDLILERLRQFRQAGLGDPEDHHEAAGVATASASTAPADARAAARELLVEARALRSAVSAPAV
jgi:hypothetical protein